MKVVFNQTKLIDFLYETRQEHLKAYQSEVMQVINEVGTIIFKGPKLFQIQFPSLTVNLPKNYLIKL